MNGEKIFWMVLSRHADDYRKIGEDQPTEEAACQHAKQCARMNPGKRFYIVRVQEYFETQDVVHSTILLQS